MRWYTKLLLIVSLAATTTAKEEPGQSVTPFKSEPYNLVYFDDSEVLLFPDEGNVWISRDSGFKWETLKEVDKADAIIKHPYDNKVAVIIGDEIEHWITKDQGKTWKSFETPTILDLTKRAVSFHATDSDRILLQGIKSSGLLYTSPIYYTLDGFSTAPEILHEDVLSCLWAKTTDLFMTKDEETDKNRILCNVEGEFSWFESESRVLITDDFFKTKGYEPLIDDGRAVSGIISIASVTGYLAAAARSTGSNELALYVTDDTETWHRAEFGNHKVVENAYTILESTNYSMQVDVMISDEPAVGVLFTSNSNGTFFTRNVNNTNRSPQGYVDFEKVQNIPGIVLVNTVSNFDKIEKGKTNKKEVITQISFDDGRTWQSLRLDKKHDLHLHSVTDQKNTGRVYSSPAPGIIMGVGNSGDYLKAREDGDTYVSDDAGLTWKQALKGPHLYETGDQGAILVAIADGVTDEISWSLNHGADWTTTTLDFKVEALALTTTPDSTSLKFLLMARKAKKDSDGEFAIIALDFSKLDKSTCKDKDFEKWSALVDEEKNAVCFMGRTWTFNRRKADADCFVNHEFKDPIPQGEKCKCRAADYECDYGFHKGDVVNGTFECQPDGPVRPPAGACKDPKDTYEGPSGYRLIPGNECETKGGFEPEAREYKCDGEDTHLPSGALNATQNTFTKDKEIVKYYYLERCEKCSGEDETIVALTNRGKVYVTRDHGKNWEIVDFDDTIIAIYPHQYFNDQVYFLTKDKKVYYSKNRMETVHYFKTEDKYDPEEKVAALAFHPKKPDWLIWTGERSGENIAHISRKHGDDWDVLLRRAGKCAFIYSEQRSRSEKLVYCQQYEDGSSNSSQLLSSEDWFENKEPLKEDVVNFATMSEYIVVALKDSNNSLKVDASVDGKIFADAHFPHGFEVDHQSAYTVLDSSTHAIFLHVTVSKHEGFEYGSIIKSNSNGTDYVLTINDVNRNKKGYVDFEKVQGLEGVALANVVANADDDPTSKTSKKLKTMITHNDGAEWATIPRPKSSDGFDADKKWCNGQTEVCSLHLHGYTEREDRRRSYSSQTAIAILIGNGNVGEYLDDDADTFMSTDAGITWNMIGEGRWAWAFGDRGSIIVIVEKAKGVKSLQYTLDEGNTWSTWDFPDGKIDVGAISTVPSDTSMNFIIWGEVDDHPATINVDFSGIKERTERCTLDEGQSDSSDYYLWSPQHPLQDNDCLFGHISKYHRKRPESDCYNGRTLPTLHSISEDCECTRQDYECDYNYEHVSDGSCKLVPGLLPIDPQEYCAANDNITEYYDVTGYRRIPLSTCKGGKEFDKSIAHPCPGHEDEFEQKHGISGAGLFFAIIIPIGVASAIGWYIWRNWDGKFGRIQLGDGPAGSRIGLGGAFDSDAPYIKYPVLAVSALVAVIVAIPMVVSTIYSTIRTRLGRSSSRYGSGPRFTSRGSFQRSRGNYSVVDPDEGELLGDDSEDEGT